MKLSFVLSVLASMAVLSLAAPLVASDGEEAMLQALSATLEAQGGNAASADAESTVDVETAVTSSRLVRFITVTSHRHNWMSFSWVACYDSAGNNVCAGKPASASTSYSSPWGTATTPLTATQGFGTHAGNCFHSGTPASGNWWKVDLQGDFDIRSIKFGSRNDGHQDQSSGLVITMQDKNGADVPSSRTFTTTADRTQTFDVAETAGKHAEHLSPVMELLNGLRAKLLKTQTTSSDEANVRKAAADAARKAADVATGISTEAAQVHNQVMTSTQRELEMLDKIVTMVNTLNGK